MTKDIGSVRKLPSGKHQARRWDTARGTYVSLGTFSTQEEAHRELMRADIIAEAGYVPVSSVTKDHSIAAGREPFDRYAERTLSTRFSSGAIERSTFHKYSKLLQGYLIPTFGKMAVADIRISDVERWWAAMDNNRNQRRGAYMVMSRLMKKAVKDGLTKKNPCQVEASSRDHSKKRPAFTLEDVKLLLLMEPDLQMRTMLWVLLGTGMRVGEALALDWQDVDLNEGISVRTKEGMAEKKRQGAVFGRVVAPEFLPTYRRVLDMHANGTSLNAIARTLNEAQVPTAKGAGRWYASTVRAIVSSETAKTMQ